MKKNFVLGLAALSMLTFASCTKEATTNADPNAVPEGTPTTATITLKSAPATMADPAKSTPEEEALKNVTLFVFNNADVLETITPFQQTDMDAKKITFNTTTGMKRLFICANMGSSLPPFSADPASPTTLDVFKKTILGGKEAGHTPITDISTITSTTNGFWMTNIDGQPAQVNVVVGTNMFTVKIGRISAKVNLKIGSGVNGVGGKLEDVKYTPMNNPDAMYLQPVYNGTNYMGNQLLTPYYDKAWTDVSVNDYFPGAKVDLATPTYVTENSNETIMAGKSTYLLVEGTWTPDVTLDTNGENPQAGVKGQAFWRIISAGTTDHPSGFESGYYRENPSTTVTAGKQTAKYTDGKCYYAIYLQDKTVGSDTELALRYTIKRNTYFTVTINSISGAGTDAPGGVIPTDPSQPVETTTALTVEVMVADWTMVNQSAGI